MPRELREAGWNIGGPALGHSPRPGGTGRAGAFGDSAPSKAKPPRKKKWCYVHTAPGGKQTTQFERPGWPEEPPSAPPLRRMRPLPRDPFLALPGDVVDHALSFFCLDPWVRDSLGLAPLDGLGYREWQNDEELATVLSFAACSQACRRAARSDVHWRERLALLDRTYAFTSESADTRAWRPRSLDGYVDPRSYNPKCYAKKSPFDCYQILAHYRRNVRYKITRMYGGIGDAGLAGEAETAARTLALPGHRSAVRAVGVSDARDRALLQRLADSARAQVQACIDEGEHGNEWEGRSTVWGGLALGPIGYAGGGGYSGDCNCTHDGANCVAQSSYDSAAAAIVDHVLKELDAGVVGNVRNLIVRGFAGFVVPRAPGQEEEFDMDFLISRCGALNPLHCDYSGWENDDDSDTEAIAVAEATVAGDI